MRKWGGLIATYFVMGKKEKKVKSDQFCFSGHKLLVSGLFCLFRDLKRPAMATTGLFKYDDIDAQVMIQEINIRPIYCSSIHNSNYKSARICLGAGSSDYL